MQSVFNTSELLLHIAKRLPDKDDVLSMRAVCKSARTGIDITEARRFRDTSRPHLCFDVDYVVHTKRREILAQLLVAENTEDFSATLPPMLLLLQQDTEEMWSKHVRDSLLQQHRGVDPDYTMSCKLYLEKGCDSETGLKFVNHFLREELEYSAGEFQLCSS